MVFCWAIEVIPSCIWSSLLADVVVRSPVRVVITQQLLGGSTLLSVIARIVVAECATRAFPSDGDHYGAENERARQARDYTLKEQKR
jgi:hypothetical protein